MDNLPQCSSSPAVLRGLLSHGLYLVSIEYITNPRIVRSIIDHAEYGGSTRQHDPNHTESGADISALQ